MRVVFVNRYFYPDHSATSQMASDLAFQLAREGWEVVVVTSGLRYDDPSARLPRRESVAGLNVRRVWSTRFGRANLVGRLVDYLTFYLSAWFLLLRLGRCSIVVAMTDPPLLSVLAAFAPGRVINWLQDLFPEVATALGVRAPGILRAVRDWSLRRARANVVLGDLMAERVPNATVIHNWADAALQPVPREQNRLRRELGLGESFVVGYSGNLGRAHDAATIAGAVELAPEVTFLFTGAGAKLDVIRNAGGPNVRFLPYQPRETLADALSAADAHLVTLDPAVEGLIVPSKFYGVLAVARPVIFVGSRSGELARLIEEHACGVVIEAGDAGGLAAAIRRLASDRGTAEAMGRRGRELYDARFTPAHAFAAWQRLLENVAR